MQLDDKFDSHQYFQNIIMIEELQLRKKSNADMYTFNSATLETEFWIDVDLISVGANSSSIGEWILWPPVIQHMKRNVIKYLDLAET